MVYATGLLTERAERAEYKATALAALQSAGWRPTIGIGDRPSDFEAYSQAGMTSLMVDHFPQGASDGGGGGGVDTAGALRAVRGMFASRRDEAPDEGRGSGSESGHGSGVASSAGGGNDPHAEAQYGGSKRLAHLAALQQELAVPGDRVAFFWPRDGVPVWPQVAKWVLNERGTT